MIKVNKKILSFKNLCKDAHLISGSSLAHFIAFSSSQLPRINSAAPLIYDSQIRVCISHFINKRKTDDDDPMIFSSYSPADLDVENHLTHC
ncbi:CLUMA_CG021608, isoform A [Clunio marinus]|uniref:CLUMA_CG021608, isoform A n=1 Tax=Clunio marinus TaxID=568069 RepID=A0A1J1JBW6_9DIPT|nr:CLUMA_CG021608, isoform A [Clunio marinus]